MSREAMKRIKTWHERCEEHPDHQERIITERMIQERMQEEIDELRQALSEQPSHQEVDWEKLYRLEVKKKEALAAKYERDTGKKLTRIVPMAEPALRQALEIEQKPVAWYCNEGLNRGVSLKQESPKWAPLYTAPKQWVWLTDDEIEEIQKSLGIAIHRSDFRAIEAKLKEKNT